MTVTPGSDVGASTPLWWRVLRVVVGAICAVVGAGMVVAAFTLGSCDAFGGRCPSTPSPLLEDDVFWTAALGAGLAVGALVFLARPSRRRALVATAWAAAAAGIVGLVARSVTSA